MKTLMSQTQARYHVAKAIFDLLVWIPEDEQAKILRQAVDWLDGTRRKEEDHAGHA